MAYHFDTSYYNVITGPTVTPSPTEYTVAVWTKVMSVATSRHLSCRSNSGGPTSGWTHQLIMGGTFSHYAYDGSAKSVSGGTVVVQTWYHVVITAKNSGLMYLYVDGVSIGSPLAIGTLWTGGDRWYFGGSSDGSGRQTWWGDVGYLCLWNKQLTDSEIWNLYKSKSKLTPLFIQSDSIIFYSPMNSIEQGGNYPSPFNKWATCQSLNVTQIPTGNIIGSRDFLTMG